MPNMGSKYGTYKCPMKPRGGKPGYGGRRVQVSGADWSARDRRAEFVHNPPDPDEDVSGPMGSYLPGSRELMYQRLDMADIPSEPPSEEEDVEQFGEEYEED